MAHRGLLDPAGHHAIHLAAAGEIEETMAVLRRALREAPARAPEVAAALLDVWRERILAHAQAEEESVYADVDGGEGARLLRDHELLRIWVAEASRELEGGRMTGAAMARLEALVLLLGRHGADEERWLARRAPARATDPAPEPDPAG